jgi:hypothetical protein
MARRDTGMSRLKYWKIRCLDDHDCYSIRRKTKKEAMVDWASLLQDGSAKEVEDEEGFTEWKGFEPPRKIEINYRGGTFGLIDLVTSEGKPET